MNADVCRRVKSGIGFALRALRLRGVRGEKTDEGWAGSSFVLHRRSAWGLGFDYWPLINGMNADVCRRVKGGIGFAVRALRLRGVRGEKTDEGWAGSSFGLQRRSAWGLGFDIGR